MKDWPIMHFTHVDNLSGIAASEGLHADCIVRASSRNGAVRECGDQEIKERRRKTYVRVAPGGVVGDYVPFYFAPRSPMLYKIFRGGVSTYQGGQDPLVYLVSSLRIVHAAGLSWVGSDGNIAVTVTEHTNDWEVLEDIVDWPLMGERYWNDTEHDGDRMRRRMAELLIYKFMPLEHIEYVVAKSSQVAEAASRHLGGRLEVKVRPAWYY